MVVWPQDDQCFRQAQILQPSKEKWVEPPNTSTGKSGKRDKNCWHHLLGERCQVRGEHSFKVDSLDHPDNEDRLVEDWVESNVAASVNIHRAVKVDKTGSLHLIDSNRALANKSQV